MFDHEVVDLKPNSVFLSLHEILIYYSPKVYYINFNLLFAGNFNLLFLPSKRRMDKSKELIVSENSKQLHGSDTWQYGDQCQSICYITWSCTAF